MAIAAEEKHAYLIMAHNNFDQLQVLLDLLDDERNDIYLHVDKKARDFCPCSLKTHHASLIEVERIKVNWGGHSQIKCEMSLLKAAAPKHYRYYHLLSGLDLPLKTQDEIHTFFAANAGKNFIRFDPRANQTKDFVSRTQYFYFLQDIIGRNRGRRYAVLEIIEKYCLALQEKLGIRRKALVPLYKGTQWFSIKDDLVQYLLGHEAVIKKQFRFSKCADEVFLHSLVMASPFRNSVVDNSLRAIDWKRGSPYTYQQEDVSELLSSACLFARKFDSKVDRSAIDAIAAHLMQ